MYIMSSLHFLDNLNGNVNSYLRIPNNGSLNFGTGDFTIEWYQYQTDSNNYPRVFQINNSIGVSIEGGTFYYWRSNNRYDPVITMTPPNYKNTWVHFAMCRLNNVTTIFMNGNPIFTKNNDANNYTSVSPLVIGNESSSLKPASTFGGYIAYFSWVKGVAIYNSNFSPPTNYPALTSNHVLLLTADKFYGTLGNSVINTNVSTIQNVPSGFATTPPVFNINQPLKPKLKSLFSDNSIVFYKPGSLSSCGVGTVRNSSIKSRKT